MATEPQVFEDIFGTAWAELPPVFRLHYANRKNCQDVVRAVGRMDIWQCALMRPFAVLFRAMGTLVPVTENDIETEVVFRTRANSSNFWYDRSFTLGSGQRYQFVSQLEPVGGAEVIEWTGAMIGWHSTFAYDGTRVRLEHVGYRLKLGRLNLPLPMTWLFGRPSAWEEAINDKCFQMEMTINHPILGLLYRYAGRFEIAEVSLEK
jgi:hypothetical protein